MTENHREAEATEKQQIVPSPVSASLEEKRKLKMPSQVKQTALGTGCQF
jgi:hypothetical protein